MEVFQKLNYISGIPKKLFNPYIIKISGLIYAHQPYQFLVMFWVKLILPIFQSAFDKILKTFFFDIFQMKLQKTFFWQYFVDKLLWKLYFSEPMAKLAKLTEHVFETHLIICLTFENLNFIFLQSSLMFSVYTMLGKWLFLEPRWDFDREGKMKAISEFIYD